ncbi:MULTISPECIES: hypothetical protein [Bradyrhizobium]|uniref:Uncharacterized protein n=2 Tax=Bradyrhizobium quebecense TaxID=2748629 RepID=A0A974AH48_9BRAD|nr:MULTISPECIES: hypothetical protein [Bradyrhizobium]UFX44297.1 hypothetical protein HAP47_0035350 [Bradyrhizobium sp. 41S5]UGA44307.1 hypothetical protein HU230_0040030 [Bradyrhizobium quebecense]UGY00530.1 hypothetical protein J4P68_0025175 [Bradyrhizobium quebecense]
MKAEMDALEACKSKLTDLLASAEAPAALAPEHAESIGSASLHCMKACSAKRRKPRRRFRTLIDQVTLVLDGEQLAIVLRGDLAAILRFAADKKNPDFLSEAWALDGLLSQTSVVAEPDLNV